MRAQGSIEVKVPWLFKKWQRELQNYSSATVHKDRAAAVTCNGIIDCSRSTNIGLGCSMAVIAGHSSQRFFASLHSLLKRCHPLSGVRCYYTNLVISYRCKIMSHRKVSLQCIVNADF